MRILRNLLFIVAIVAGIVLAVPNMTPVRFVYLPSVPFVATGEPLATDVPLALLLLAFLLAGAFLAGTGTFAEHVRLRFLVRRNSKVVRGLRNEIDKLRGQLEENDATLAARTSDLAGEQARARRAEEGEARALALAEQERVRADDYAASAEAALAASAEQAALPAPEA